MKRIPVVLILILASCSVSSLYFINIDLLSFLREENLQQSFFFPPSPEVNIYYLPGVQLDVSNSGPDNESAAGVLVNFAPQDTSGLGDLSVKLSISISIKNDSAGEQITGDRISLYAASSSSSNIYNEGIRFDLINIPILNPGEQATLEQDFYFEENSILTEILNSGSMRIGIGVFLTGSAASMPASCRLEKFQISSNFSPLKIIIDNYP